MHLDRTSFPAWRAQLLDAEARGQGQPAVPRRYPGYSRVELPTIRRRWWTPLDRVLTSRRVTTPRNEQPSPRDLARLLALSHGITGEQWRGPTPSAGCLQGLELFVSVLSPGWLGPGVHHYDRAGHALAQVADCGREELVAEVPSLGVLSSGALLWLIVGDGARVTPKYGDRGRHFLALEAGHLMQNLCLVSASIGRTTVPLGGYFEEALARRLNLPRTDEVLYVGVFG